MEPENNTSDPGPDPRIAAALSYLLPPLSGIFFILKENGVSDR